jgi:predicted kinase
VRTHVAAHSRDLAAASAYLDAAIAHLDPPPASLAAVGGRSGSGKSSFARLVAPGLGASPGAVILRSDEIRKRLAGAAPDAGLPDAAYGPGTDAAVYDARFAEAARLLAAGRAVALDATFLKPELRARAAATAQAAGVPFEGLWLDAPPEALAARVAARRGDASDATPSTLAAQLGVDPGPLDWRLVDASGPVEAAAEAWAACRGSVAQSET